MNISEYIVTLHKKGIKLWLANGALRFKAIANAMTPEIKAELRRLKPQIIEVLSTSALVEIQQNEAIPIQNLNPSPLSFAQERLWFLEQYSKGQKEANYHYNIPLLLRLKGNLRVDALQNALKDIQGRHSLLRATFNDSEGQPETLIHDDLPLPMQSISCKTEIEAKQNLEDFAKHTFNLEHGPLWRILLIRLGDQEHLLACLMHHIVSDGWSMGVISRELSVLYRHHLEPDNQASSLPPLPIQYSDFAHWQRQRLQGEGMEKQLNFWKQTLADLPILHELKTDFPRPRILSHSGDHYRFLIPYETAQSLITLAHSIQATPFMIMEAIFAVLLCRYSGREDIVIGTPTAGRDHVQTHNLVGFFVNTVVLRNRMENNPSFMTFLDRFKTQTLNAFENADAPFEKLVDHLQPQRDPGLSPLFQIMFSFVNFPDAELSLPGLHLYIEELETNVTKFDLNMTLSHGAHGFEGSLEFNTALFKSETIAKMASHFLTLSQSVARAPNTQIAYLSMLPKTELNYLLEHLNQTSGHGRSQSCAHTPFERQALKTPDALAVSDGTSQLTYHDLNSRANQLAHHLRGLGVNAGDRVGLMIERSLEMMIALYGILKAGAVYVPIDPTYPASRVSFMVSDCDARLLLTREFWLKKHDDQEGLTLCIDRDWQQISMAQASSSPTNSATPDHLLYIIYTSGSTGKPKGAAVYHRGFHNLVSWFIEEFKLTSEDSMLLTSSISFDLTQKNLYAPLWIGANLILSPAQPYDPVVIVEMIQKWQTTWMNSTPSAFYPLIEDSLPNVNEALKSLLWVCLGGEPLSIARMASWLESPECQAQIVNGYGPTECTDISNFKILTEPLQYLGKGAPIGKPIHGVKLLILDAHQGLVPNGVQGELAISGPSVGFGYIRNPIKTALKFLPNPYSQIPGDRLYLTGDVVHYGEDGDIVFIGRRDHQIKLRGFRIELGEIEAALIQHQAVREAVALIRQDEDGYNELIAYIQLENQSTVPDFNAYLADHIPSYMIPQFITMLPKFPETPNGKIDRTRLASLNPESFEEKTSHAQSYIAPRNPIELKLVKIFEEVLEKSRVSVLDNFFKIGGHSLLATQVMARIRRHMDVDLPLRVLFEKPSVESIAPLIDQAAQQLELNIEKRPEDLQNIPLSFAQERLFFLYQLEGPSSTYNLPGTIDLEGTLNPKELENALNALIARHESLRTRFIMIEGKACQIVEPDLEVGIEQVDLQNLSPEALSLALEQYSQTQALQEFRLEEVPLIRLQLLRTGPQHWRLLINMHHIVSDGWSMEVFYRELSVLYRYHLESDNQLSPLPPLSIQYGDFAYWQRQRLKDSGMDKQLDFWKDILADLPTLHELKTDFPRPRMPSHSGDYYHFLIPSETAESLVTLAQSIQATSFMIMESIFAVLLCRYSGRDDIVIGTPFAGRNHGQTQDLIGFFVNTLVLRNRLEHNPSFMTFLDRFKTQTLNAYDNADAPFEKLVDLLQPQRDPGLNPLFQIMFSFANASSSELSFPGLNLYVQDLDVDVAKFDLHLNLSHTDQGFEGGIEYNTALFKTETIAKMASHFVTLAQSVVRAPNTQIAYLNMLQETEQSHLLEHLNQTGDHGRSLSCAHTPFEHQALKTPDALAVSDGISQLTYHELNFRANQLANHLRGLGINPGDRVGLMIERSLDMMIALYGILKAGAAYVPIDPTYPMGRVSFMLSDCDARLLLTRETWLKQHGELEGNTLCMDRDWQQIRLAQVSVPPANSATPNHLQYIIYTSGSTGKPKGAAVYHRGFHNLVSWFIEDFKLTSNDSMLLTSSVSFDLTQKNLYAPLWIGAPLILSPAHPYDPVILVEMIQKWQTTWMNCTPSAFYPLIEDSLPNVNKALQSLRWVFLGGEPISIARMASWLESPECQAQIVNTYGPTECTDISNYKILTEPLQYLGKSTPIGKPIHGVKLLILDTHQGLVPNGVQGELTISGPSVGYGYLGDPIKTALKFLPNPYSQIPDDRLYLTGDVVHYSENGDVVFIGRRDHQIKIRGFRIELGEIEAALILHDAVREAVALIRQEENGHKELVAYIQLEEQASEPDFNTYLADHIPSYMIPQTCTILPKFPETPSGKIDRTTLASWNPERLGHIQQNAHTYVAPRNPIEFKLSKIFEEVLEKSSVSVLDNFFKIGGHSLLATQVMTRIRKHLDVDLPLRVLFEKPSIASLAKRIEETARQLEFNIEKRPEHLQNIPLSFAQERLFFLYQFEGPSSTYNLPAGIDLEGTLNPKKLEKALNALITRHESLRTRFLMVEDRAYQIVEPDLEVGIAQIDLRHLSPDALSLALKEYTEAHALQEFRLEEAPLINLQLLRTGLHHWRLLINMHHIVSDGWSIPIFIEELTHLYKSGNIDLKELPIQYADYSCWQRSHHGQASLDQQLVYWRKKLEGHQPLNLPTDKPRPAMRKFVGGHQQRILPITSLERLKKLSGEQSATLFMTLLSAFNVLLARHSGQVDFCVGTPVAGRKHAEIEGLIGFFLNTLVLRANLEGLLKGQLCFKTLLGRTRETALAAYDNQDLPFEQLLADFNPERDLSQTPIFQVFFNLINVAGVQSESRDEDLKITPVEMPDIGSKFDITVYASEMPEGLHLNMHYNAGIFESKRMNHMLSQYIQFLELIPDVMDRPLSSLSLVTEQDRRALPDPIIHLEKTYRGSICSWIEVAAKAHALQVAIRTNDLELSYAELLEQMYGLSHHLKEKGIQPGDVVTIHASRCPTLIPAILAVMHVGATYAILDPAYPVSRRAQLLQSMGTSAFLQTEAATKPEPILERAIQDLNFYCHLSQDFLKRFGKPQCNGSAIQAHDIACLNATSGSTGEPKIIQARHGSLTHFLPYLKEAFQFSSGDRFSMLSGLAHDPLQRDIFTSLSMGASLCIPSGDDIGPYLANWMFKNQISVAHLTPAMVQLLTESHELVLNKLRLAFITGEALTSHVLKRLHNLSPGVEAVNFYGTTETQRAVACYRTKTNAAADDSQVISLGRGIPGVQLLVLTQMMKRAAIGEIGHIYVRSAHLAAGYLNNPERTAQCFLQNPFSDDPHDRIYRTGDLGRYDHLGQVHTIGRADFQVQIRGYRVETSEIEMALTRIEGLSNAHVMARGDLGNQWLVAFVVCDGTNLSEARLRNTLRKNMPDFMIPSAFVFLEEMPLTPNGKLDRHALNHIDVNTNSEEQAESPQDEVESSLAAIFAQVLGRESVTRHQNFFYLGGHSLLAAQVISRIESIFHIKLPLRTLFEANSVALLAQALRKQQSVTTIPLEPVLSPGILSPAQKRLWYLNHLEGPNPAYNMAWPLRFQGPLSPKNLEQAFEQVSQRHQILRQMYPEDRNGPSIRELQNLPPLHIVDLQHDPSYAEKLIQQETLKTFDLAKGPLFRTTLIRLDRQEHILLLTMHHIISDAWSMGILHRDIAAAYQALVQQQEPPFTPLPVQYVDYAHWQNSRLQERLAEDLLWWEQSLSDFPALLELPTDRSRPALQTFKGAAHHFSLTPQLSQAILTFARPRGLTPFMVLQSVFALMLHRYSGQDQIAVGTPISNRNHPHVEELIGFFVNTLVLANRFETHSSFESLLKRNQGMILSSFARGEIPFEIIIKKLNPPRCLSYSPLFQAMFVYYNMPTRDDEFYGLKGDILSNEEVFSKYDLNLNMSLGDDHCFHGRFEYNAHLFQNTTVQGWARHYRCLLEAAIQNPDCSLSALALMSETEKQRLLDLSVAASLPPMEKNLSRRFEKMVSRHPHKIALIFEMQRYSYRDLDQMANGIAWSLRSAGIRIGDIVGIYQNRQAKMVASVIAIWKLGASYVPLDPIYPKDRITMMLEDVKPKAILLSDHLDLSTSLPKIPIARIQPEVHGPVPTLLPNAMAYIIFTSGSSGRPKGVAIRHESVSALFHFCDAIFSKADLSLSFAGVSLSFDVSVFDLFMPLTSGGTLLLGESLLALPSCELKHEVTCINTVPSLMEHLLKLDALPKGVRVINLAGETAHASLTNALYERDHIRAVYNFYGPTEDTVYSTGALLPRFVPERPGIGKTLSGTKALILDKHNKVLPPGVPGQMALGGVGLSMGYMGRPALTAEKFVPDPYAVDPGDRLYLTGDLVRLIEDHHYDFLGRIDFQVKINGMRIELAEIETALGEQEHILSSTVLVSENRLVAFATGAFTSQKEILARLAQRLPQHMLPRALWRLEEIPILPNGKLNRKALEKEALRRLRNIREQQEETQPRTPMEASLLTIWKYVLEVETLHVTDNFFDMGGDSISSFHLVTKAAEAGLQFTARDLFANPSIRQLAPIVKEAASIESIQQSLYQIKEEDVPFLPAKEGISDLYPLTGMQESMLFNEVWKQSNDTYFQQLSVTLTGKLNVSQLRDAWARLIARHDILRTSFHYEGLDHSLQVVHKHLEVPFECLDWREHNALQIDKDLDNLSKEEREKGFEMTKPPLMRIKLVWVSDQRYQLIWSFHHILLDGWSTVALIDELGRLYHYNDSSRLAPAIPFKNYLTWLASQDKESGQSYWQKNLAAIHMPTPLPGFDSSLPEGRSRKLRRELNASASEGLRRFASQNQLTLAAIIQGAWGLLLNHYSGMEHVLFGLVTSGRPSTLIDSSKMAGLFIQTLPVVLRIDKQMELPSYFKGVQDAHLERENQAFLSLPELKALSPLSEKDALFHSLVVVENFRLNPGQSALTQHDLHVLSTDFRGSDQNSAFPLVLGVVPGPQIEIIITHDNRRMTPIAAQTLHEALLTLLKYISKPEAKLQNLPLDPLYTLHLRGDRIALLQEQTALEMIESQVKQRGTAIAIEQDDLVYTYAQMDQYANQLAHELLAHGVSNESRVGLYARRKPQLIVAILAIQKAGGIYVPLDPTLPIERLKIMVGNSGIQAVLGDTLPLDFRGVQLPLVFTANQPRSKPKVPILPSQAAYMIYTSGSTGIPKGVMVSHDALANLTRGRAKAYSLGPGDRTLQSVSMNFDAAIGDIFSNLAAGSTLVLRSEAMMSTTGAWMAALSEKRITIAGHTPSFWAQVAADQKELVWPSHFRLLLSGGDRWSSGLLDKLSESKGHCPQCVNGYGPAEACVITSALRFEPSLDPMRTWNQVPLGGTLEGVSMNILDSQLHKVPLGAVGEIVIGGRQLARGYHDLPARTAEQFVPDPFSKTPGARMYKSGDQARSLGHGLISFVGRMDHQVKIRGFRVELGAIARCLEIHDNIAQAAVFFHAPNGRQKKLIAYLRFEANPLHASSLREYCKEHLPHYMVPQSFVHVPVFPVTTLGKIDVDALPEPQQQPIAHEEPSLPTSPLEHQLVQLWQNILKVDEVGIHDDFFELGGHSLLLTRLLGRIEVLNGRHLTLKDFLKKPTIATMAEQIQFAIKRHDLPSIKPNSKRKSLSFAQQRLWFLYKLNPQSNVYNVPLIMDLKESFSIAAASKALKQIYDRHSVLRTCFTFANNQVQQNVLPMGTLEPKCFDFSHLGNSAKAIARDLAKAEALIPFDLENDPPIRAHFYQCPDSSIIVITLHHIACDGWSMDLLRREFEVLYENTLKPNNQSEELPPLPIQYSDYAQWQRELETSGYFDEQETFWRKTLKGAPKMLPLPFDKKQGERTTHRGGRLTIPLDPHCGKLINNLCEETGTTPFMVLHGLLALLLSRFAGVNDLIIGSPVANRAQPQTQPLIGFFVNTLALRHKIEPTQSFASFLSRTRDLILNGVANQDLPFERVVEQNVLERRANITPLFQVMMTWTQLEEQPLSSPEKSSESIIGKDHAAKFTLNFSFRSQGNHFSGELIYNSDLFYESTMIQLTHRFRELIKELSLKSQVAMTHLTFLSLPEQPDQQTMVTDESQPATLYLKPRTKTEKTLSVIWQNLLDISRVGRNDNFFELGGHSLLSLQLMGEIETHFERNLGIGILFEKQTLKELAELIDRPQAIEDSCLKALNQVTLGKPLFVFHPIGGGLHAYHKLANKLNYPVFGLQSLATMDHASLDTIEKMALHYVEAILKAQPADSYRLAGWSLGGAIAYAAAVHLKSIGKQVELTLIDSYIHSEGSRIFQTNLDLLRHMLGQPDRPLHNHEALNTLNEDQLLNLAAEKDQTLSRQQLQNLWAIYKKNYTAIRSYRPKAYSDSVRLIQGKPPSQSHASAAVGWRPLISDLEVIELDYSHDEIIQAQELEKLIPQSLYAN